MKLFHGSLRKKLYMLVLLATLPSFLVLMTIELVNREQLIRHSKQDVSRILESLSEIQHHITDSTETLLRTVASIPEMSELDEEKSKILLSTLLQTNPMYTNAILVDLKGNVVAAGLNNNQSKGLNFSDRKHFIDAIARGGFSTGEFVVGKQSNQAIFPFAMAVPDSRGQPVGAIIIGFSLKYYQELFESNDNYEDNFFGLCDHNGLRVFRYPYTEDTEVGVPIKDVVYQAASKNVTGSLISNTSAGGRYLIAYTPIQMDTFSDPYMYMFLGQNYSVINQRGMVLLLRLMISSLISLFLALALARYAGEKIISSQIDRLSRAALRFSQGEKNVFTGIDYSDGEIGSLARSFDSMVKTIRSREDERNGLVQQLNQSQKMDAIGQLAGGIAHDFNNLLSGIMGAAELLEFELPLDNFKSREYQQLIVLSATRAAELASQLLAFSRTSSKVSKIVDAHKLISETVLILKNTVDRRIEIKIDLKAANSQVVGDPSLLQSALLNLGINASHSIKSMGYIEILTYDTELDEKQCRQSAFDLNPGSYLVIEVKDNGCGIAKEIQEKIFEPFFTTKKQGEGTGLGLSAVYGTLKNSGGSITVHSQEDKGTLFRLMLPHGSGLTTIDTLSPGNLIKGKGKILVVDDEETVRKMATMALKKFGYNTVSAPNGQIAIEIIKEEGQSIDLILLDMIMPEMNGKDCFKKIQKIAPHIPVLLCSGMIRDEDLNEMIRGGIKGFLPKPYKIYELSKAVNRLMNS